MPHLDIAPWEPEETVGKLWHRLASRMDPPPHFPDAAVRFDDMRGRIAVLFRGLGGAADVELKPVALQASRHRISWRRRLAFDGEHLARASFDGAALRLPAELAVFPDRDDNAALYLWLAAASAHAPGFLPVADPFLADLAAIRAGVAMAQATLEAAPGLRARVRMEGDAFEMEDQRQWGDASLKTYNRPLALPWPYAIRNGVELRQAGRISWTPAPAAKPVAPIHAQVPGATFPQTALVLTANDARRATARSAGTKA